MAVTSDKSAPYAPASAILDLIARYRARGLPSPVTAEVLARAGVSDSLISRTLQAMQTLDLIGEDGQPSSTFEKIRLAPESEYKERLKEWLNSAYADVISFVDPEKDDEVKVRDAFRSYQPIGQQPRMVSLFLGLYAAAGITAEKAQSGTSSRQLRPPRRITPVHKLTKPKDANNPNRKTLNTDSSGVPPALAGLLSSLPANGQGWTREVRDKFLATFGTVLDFCFPFVEHDELDDEDIGDE